MPQLVPFYFTNQMFYGFASLSVIVYLFSMYILPHYTEMYVTRMFITKT
uniref:ATP synthase protein 8 n=1 Tax=Yarrowia galli TaxID=197054 RepID=G4U505_9ASCO|nr:ATP synthase F0 subunit 8 [Yarrowia galli]AAA78260.1 ATP synthase 8 [Yarrowia lipolytica]CCC29057.1 subunit 8 of ATP synthetase [Yarrowia galli]